MVQHTAPTTHQRQASWATGGTVFAGVLMMITGILGILNGIAGIATNSVYAQVGNYVYKFSLTGWGWIHLIIGALLAIAGWGVMAGATWARAVGIVLAALYMIEWFLFLPYAPVWALISIALAGFVIWSLATSDRDTVRGTDRNRTAQPR
jgi:hypothetical protein